MSEVRACGAPKNVQNLICKECVCDGKEDVQRLAFNAQRVIKALELMDGQVDVVKVSSLLKLLKRK